MKYKVVDKVRIIKSFDFPDMVGRVYKVGEVQPLNSIFACRVIDEKTGWSPLMYGKEIEKMPTKGQQLLFEFMDNAV